VHLDLAYIMTEAERNLTAAYLPLGEHRYQATALTRGPWDARHQHAGPPIALTAGVIEQVAAMHGLDHLARLTANLLRPVPIAELHVQVDPDYVGRNTGHFSARLMAEGKEVGRFTALAQRLGQMPLPASLPGHPLPHAPLSPEASPETAFPFEHHDIGYFDLVETRLAAGRFFQGPSAVWFRLRHALVAGQTPSHFQRVAVAADSGNGISAILDLRHALFVNSDLTINLLRPALGEWVCLDARTHLGHEGSGLAESALYDEAGLIGRATQSLFVRPR
jgi:hypothetical protein